MKEYLEKITRQALSEIEWQLLQEITIPKSYQKNEWILEEGKRCNQLWYLQSGAVRFFENIRGEFRTTHFFMAPSMFTVYHSLITGLPSELYIEATEESETTLIPYDKLIQLYGKHHRLERIGRVMAEFQFVSEFNRRRLLLNMDALERYEYLEAHQPDVFQHFQLKDIATYLGITPVSLSRLRKYRLSKK